MLISAIRITDITNSNCWYQHLELYSDIANSKNYNRNCRYH